MLPCHRPEGDERDQLSRVGVGSAEHGAEVLGGGLESFADAVELLFGEPEGSGAPRSGPRLPHLGGTGLAPRGRAWLTSTPPEVSIATTSARRFRRVQVRSLSVPSVWRLGLLGGRAVLASRSGGFTL